MPDTIPNLWPEQIKVNIQSPYAILRVQAGLLGKLTRGILQGAVEKETVKDKQQHRLVVIAPAYNSYRHTLLTVLHDPALPYPAEVRAEALAERVPQDRFPWRPASSREYVTAYPYAHSDDELISLVGKALKSPATTAAIQSLLARSNDANPPTAPDSHSNEAGAEPGSHVDSATDSAMPPDEQGAGGETPLGQ